MLKALGILLVAMCLLTTQVSAQHRPALSKPPIPGTGEIASPNQQKPTTNNQLANEDKRGTKDSPLIIDMANPPNADAIATELKKNREDQVAENGRGNIFNILLVLVGIGQGIVLFYTALVVNKSADAAKESAEAASASVRAFIDSERGRLFINEIKLIKKDANDPQPTVDYTFVNAGRGTVVLIQGSIECNLVGTELPSIVTFNPTKVFGANNPVTPNSIIGSNTGVVFLPRCSVEPSLTATEIAKTANKQAYILFKGFIRYRTGFNDIYRRNFASVYGTHGEYFSEVTIPGYNEEHRE